MDDKLLRLYFLKQADLWLKDNPLFLNSQEKQKFINDLLKFIDCYTNNQVGVIRDEVYDFLVQRNLIIAQPREEKFLKYLTQKYKSLNNMEIMDVGAGRVCPLSRAMAMEGAKVTAIDPNIRLDESVLKKENIDLLKRYFQCDQYSTNNIGTDINKYDLIVGLEPCDATEHIIRQSLKYDKPFDIRLCTASHKSLDGKEFETYEEWYEHLAKISKDISILNENSGYIATNNPNL